MTDMKMKAVVKVRTDSTAAKAMTWRRGVGRTRHFGREVSVGAGGGVGGEDHD